MKISFHFPMNKLLQLFEQYYEFLYNNRLSSAELKKEIDLFDLFFDANREFVQAFNRERGELLVSDREIAAFILALKNCTIL